MNYFSLKSACHELVTERFWIWEPLSPSGKFMCRDEGIGNYM